MDKINSNKNELKSLILKIQRYECRINYGEKQLTMECEKLKIILARVNGNYKRTRILNSISRKYRNKINKKINLFYSRFYGISQPEHLRVAS